MCSLVEEQGAKLVRLRNRDSGIRVMVATEGGSMPDCRAFDNGATFVRFPVGYPAKTQCQDIKC